MLIFHLIWILSIFGKNIIDTELLSYEESLQKLALARSKLNESIKLSELTPLSLEIHPKEWLINKIIPRTKINFLKPVKIIKFLTMKPIGIYRDTINSLNIALLVGYEDGTLEVMQNNGEILCSYLLNYQPKHIATTSNYDEIKIAVISPFLTLEILTFAMEKIKKTETDPGRMHYELIKESSTQIKSNTTTTLMYYVKTGNKYWLIGDLLGNINMHLFNGTFFKEIDLSLGKITSMDRFGQTLVFSTSTSVGVINPIAFELQKACTNLFSVTDICIDTINSSSYVYVLAANKLLVLDTKNSEENDASCKGNNYEVIFTKNIENIYQKIACIRNYIVVWGEGNARIYNTSLYYVEKSDYFIEIELNGSKEIMLESYRIQNGGALWFASNNKSLYLYEVILPYKTAVPFDFGNIRLFM